MNFKIALTGVAASASLLALPLALSSERVLAEQAVSPSMTSDSVNPGTLQEFVYEYFRKLPERQLDARASTLIQEALKTNFPCKNER